MRNSPIVWLLLALCVASLPAAGVRAQTQTVEIYAAGSLRNVVGEMAKATSADYRIELRPSFGGSGLMRERIEKGEKPDLFMSADVGAPQKLAAQGRTTVPPIAFARNRICIVSRRADHLTPGNLVERMLDPKMRIKTSKPVADPGGDYAWAILDRIDELHPGKGQLLKEKAEKMMDATATRTSPDQSPTAALFASDQIDLAITYCSSTQSLEHELPELTSFEVPPALDPHPLYALAVLSDRPEAMRVALFLLSERGQAIVAAAGLVPLTGSAPPPR